MRHSALPAPVRVHAAPSTWPEASCDSWGAHSMSCCVRPTIRTTLLAPSWLRHVPSQVQRSVRPQRQSIRKASEARRADVRTARSVIYDDAGRARCPSRSPLRAEQTALHAWRVVEATRRRLTALTVQSRPCTHMHAGRQRMSRVRTHSSRLTMARASAPVLHCR